MKHALIYAACLIAPMTASAQLVPALPPNLPLFDLEVSPDNPTTAEPLTLTLSTLWPNTCIPDTQATVQPGDSIRIDLVFGDPADPDCEPRTCNPIATEISTTVSLSPVAAGTYDVYVRAVNCQNRTPFSFVGRFAVASIGGEEPTPPNGEEPPAALVAPGDRVVLLEDHPVPAPQLLAGAVGHVICCDADDCSGELLVSWAFFRGGADDIALCTSDSTPVFPTGSATWVNPATVLLGRPFDRCGVINAVDQGCLLFTDDDGATFALPSVEPLLAAIAANPQLDLGMRLRLTAFRALTRDPNSPCPEAQADLFEPVLSPCPTPTP